MITAEHIRTLPMKNKFSTTAFLTPGRLAELRTLIDAAALEPHAAERWASILARPTTYVPVGAINPWVLPYGSNPDGAALIVSNTNRDMEAVVDFAFRWAVTGDEAAATACSTILDAWGSITAMSDDVDTILTWVIRTPALIQAAVIIQDAPQYTTALHDKLVAMFTLAAKMSTAYTRENNWASWGVLYEFACASFLGNRARFDRAIQRFRSLMDASIVNNIPIKEIYREGSNDEGNGVLGLSYSNFNLNALVMACEWARFNGEWLYDYVTPDGSTIKGYWENVRYWDVHPELYPYNSSGTPSITDRVMGFVYVLNALYPHPESEFLVDTYRPVSDFYAVRNLVLSHWQMPLYG